MLLDVRPDHLKIVQDILQRFVPDHEVWAFGSRAKWLAKEYSDLDLCVLGETPLSFSTLGLLEEAFDESDLPWKVDVVDWATTSEAFRKIIERDKVVVQSLGRVSPSGRNPTNSISAHENVGLRCANPTYGAEWAWKRLGDHCSKIGSGSTPKGGKDSYLDSGPFTLIRSQNIYNEGFSLGGLAFISDEQAKKLDGVAIEDKDILLNITGDSVARVCLAPTKYLPARVNQHVAIIRPEATTFDNRFVRYFLASPIQQDLMLGLASAGATRNALTKVMIEDFKVPCPPLHIQNEIADVLSALDDRIALLRETNATLEAIAQAMFKSWFVDFDPVHANAIGRTPEASVGRVSESVTRQSTDELSGYAQTRANPTYENEGCDSVRAKQIPPNPPLTKGGGEAGGFSLPAEIAALFPDSFEESELGLVPRGWKVRKAETLLTRLSTKVRYTKEQVSSSGATPVYEQGAGILLGYHDSPAQFAATPNEPMFIFGDHTCVTHLSCEPFDISMNVIPFKGSDRSTLWTYYAIKDKQSFQEYRRHWMELAIKEIVVAPKEICDQFSIIASNLHVKMEANTLQANTLATLRDTLLPRLISGQLRLPQAEENHG